MLGALVHHALDPDELVQVTSHLDECVTCQQLVIAAVQGGVAPPQGTIGPGTSTTHAVSRALAETRCGTPAGTRCGSAATTPAGTPAGTRIGRYELRALLGVGGMGSVYDAHDAELDRAVALKVLRPELGEVPGLADRLVYESRLMAKLAHPSVITVYDAGREGDTVFIAMELIRGSTLAAWLASHPLGWRAIVSLFERAGDGLAAAHSAGIVHRDFKPDNVLVARDAEKVVVTDFGIAREAAQAAAVYDLDVTDVDTPIPAMTATDATIPAGAMVVETLYPVTVRAHATADGAVIGTPAYMAPEQIAGRKLDVRTDVFAFSVSLWEALFRARPFPGKTLAEIFTAMRGPRLRPPAGAMRVPRRLLRALRKGLAFDPRNRWPDMPALLAELVAIRASRRRISLAAGAVGLVGLGIAAALAVTRPAPPVDRCARALEPLAEAYNPRLEAQLGAVLAVEPRLQRTVVDKLRATAQAWRATHLATCHADREVAQDATTTACLDARRLELGGAVADVIEHGPAGARYASRISDVPGQPALCAAPVSGLLFARVPADRELRRKVTALRDRLADASRASGPAEVQRALRDAEQVVAAAAALWPPLHAEAQYARAMIQETTGDTRPVAGMLRDAAGAAERAHHDEVAANSWIQLAHIHASDDQNPARALEYVTYAEAAADRIGRPPRVLATLEYMKGMVLVAANRPQEGAAELHKAVALAEAIGSDYLPKALLGLAYVAETQGRYADAAAAYRRAIDQLPRSPTGQILGPPVYFERLALNLSLTGHPKQAEIEARRAVELADRTMPETQSQRALSHVHLARVLADAGRNEPALAEITGALDAIAKIQGKRSQRYGELLSTQSDILSAMGRHAEAEPQFARACEIVAFATGDDAAPYAMCEASHSAALIGLHRYAAAKAKLDRAVLQLGKTLGESHPIVAQSLELRGTAQAALGHRQAAIADFERTIAALASSQLEPGVLASARWKLGRELWTDQRPRAHEEIVAARALFESAAGKWAHERAEAAAWLAKHDRAVR